jgi:hypothetical protein
MSVALSKCASPSRLACMAHILDSAKSAESLQFDADMDRLVL